MHKSEQDTSSPPRKVLAFFNYKNILADLTAQYSSLSLEYKTLTGKPALPEHLTMPSAAQFSKRLDMNPTAGGKKFAMIDQEKLTSALHEKILLLKDAILDLHAQRALTQQSDFLHISGDEAAKKIDEVAENNSQSALNSNVIIHETLENSIAPHNPIKKRAICFGFIPNNSSLFKFMSDDNPDTLTPSTFQWTPNSFKLKQSLSENLSLTTYLINANNISDHLSLIRKKTDIVIFFFDLNDPEHAHWSFEDAKALFLEFNYPLNSWCILGLYHQSINSDAKMIFDRVLYETRIKHHIICESSLTGQAQYKGFMRSIIKNLELITENTDITIFSDPRKRFHSNNLELRVNSLRDLLDDNFLINCQCSGYYPSFVRLKAFLEGNILSSTRDISSPLVGIERATLRLSENARYIINLLSEQNAYIPLAIKVLKRSPGDIQILFFDLTDSKYAKNSFDIATNRITLLDEYVKERCLLGLYNEEFPDPQAVEIFHEFRKAQAIKYYLISDYSSAGHQQFVKLLLTLTANTPDIQKEYDDINGVEPDHSPLSRKCGLM